MNLAEYLRDRAISLVILVLCVGTVALVGSVVGLRPASVVFLCLIIVSSALAALIIDWLRRRRFYNQLKQLMVELDRVTLAPDILTHPSFFEGAQLFDALALMAKDMNDRIASYRHSEEEYRTYIETWVHEIKTPLAACQLILENNPSPANVALRKELARTDRYVEQALYFARSTSVETDYRITQIAVKDIITASLHEHQQALIDAGLTPDLSRVDTQLNVFTDQKWVVFILGQIIENALTYRQVPQPHLLFKTNHLDLGTSDERVLLSITDNGIGIAPQDLSRVFEKGFTGANGRTNTRSTGMGLYLCRTLCNKLGLGIEATSVVGQSTTITLIFPQNKLYYLQ